MFYKYSIYNIVIDEIDSSILLFNSATGAFCKLEKNIYNLIIDKHDLNDSIPFFENLKNEGFIVPSLLDEYERIIFDEKSTFFDKKPSTINFTITPTLNCNMNCIYCFENKQNRYKKLNSTTTDNIIEFIKKNIRYNQNLKELSISWFGGEPLLEYEKILYIGKSVKELCKEHSINFNSSMITNGLLLTEDRLNNLIECVNLKHLQITLDGTEEIYSNKKQTPKENFQKVLNNIKYACEHCSVNIRLNADKENIEDLKNVIDILYGEYKLAKKVYIYLAEIQDYSNCQNSNCNNFKFGEFEEIKNRFYEYIEAQYNIHPENLKKEIRRRKVSCGLICTANYVIGTEGEIYKCEHHVGDNDYIVGSITDGLYYNTSFKTYCNIHHFEKCKSCKIFPLCLSGCRMQQVSLGELAVDCKGKKTSLIKMLKKYYKENENENSN